MATGTLTVSQTAALLRLPGPWTLRRLEGRGVIPPARRSALSQERYFLSEELPKLRRLIDLDRRRASAA
jgi:DNA-binding transcriptional MerR regulator